MSTYGSFGKGPFISSTALVERMVLQCANCMTLQEIRNLDLSGRKIATLDPAVFCRMHDLETLNVSNNKISGFDYNLGLRKLRKLDISKNKLTSVLTLEQFLEVEELDLRDNDLATSDHYIAVYMLPKLMTLNGQDIDFRGTIDNMEAELATKVVSVWEEEFAGHAIGMTEKSDILALEQTFIERLKERVQFGADALMEFTHYMLTVLAERQITQVFGIVRKPLLEKAKYTAPPEEQTSNQTEKRPFSEEKTATEVIRVVDVSPNGEQQRDIVIHSEPSPKKPKVDDKENVKIENMDTTQASEAPETVPNGETSTDQETEAETTKTDAPVESTPEETASKECLSIKSETADDGVNTDADMSTEGNQDSTSEATTSKPAKKTAEKSKPAENKTPAKKTENKTQVKKTEKTETKTPAKKTVKEAETVTPQPEKRGRGRPRKHPIGETPAKDAKVKDAKVKETPAKAKDAKQKKTPLVKKKKDDTPQPWMPPKRDVTLSKKENPKFEGVHFLRCHSLENNPSDDSRNVWKCAFEPDPANPKNSTSTVATCGGNSVCLIDCKTGKVMKRYKHENVEEEFYCLAWTTLEMEVGDSKGARKSNILAIGGARGDVKLLHPEQLICYAQLRNARKTCSINTLVFHSEKPTWLFSGAEDVVLWDIGIPSGPDYKCKWVKLYSFLPPGTGRVLGIVYSPPNDYVIAGCENGCYGWNLQNKSSKKERSHTLEFLLPSVARSEDNEDDDEGDTIDGMAAIDDDIIVSKVAADKTIQIWSLSEAREKQQARKKDIEINPLHSLNWSTTDNIYILLNTWPGCGHIVCGDANGPVWLYEVKDVKKGANKKELDPNPLQLLDIPAGTVSLSKNQHLIINDVAISSDANFIVGVTSKNMVCIWKRT
ncbi:leucine-rich repeat and WD repeat-containing protein 1-like [Anneissia japonica]|uniref:leucine-rich repeat and WD repeat-containing protein 1-like n=1 Tax=Anneissia japonica TaxID=1529436 RepID=UPI0014256482|nr:leucine-rich repeat and WD repeat-containing protein 1-like [Anneissia japonica]